MFSYLRFSHCLVHVAMELPSGESLCYVIGNVMFSSYPSYVYYFGQEVFPTEVTYQSEVFLAQHASGFSSVGYHMFSTTSCCCGFVDPDPHRPQVMSDSNCSFYHQF